MREVQRIDGKSGGPGNTGKALEGPTWTKYSVNLKILSVISLENQDTFNSVSQ